MFFFLIYIICIILKNFYNIYHSYIFFIKDIFNLLIKNKKIKLKFIFLLNKNLIYNIFIIIQYFQFYNKIVIYIIYFNN